MAIVVPKPLKNGPVLTLSANNFDVVNRFQTPCWAPIEQTSSRLVTDTDKSKSDGERNWATGVLQAAYPNTENSPNTGQEQNESTNKSSSHPSINVVGIRCPKPVGMVTFEDIVGMFLQDPGRISIDFYNGGTMKKPIKPLPLAKRHGNAAVRATRGATPAFNSLHGAQAIPLYVRNNSVNKRSASSYLRKRNVSNKGKLVRAMDGADDASFELTSLEPRAIERSSLGGSSYTHNSQGGFHESTSFRGGMPFTTGLDGATDCSIDGIQGIGHRHVASNNRHSDARQPSYTNNVGMDSHDTTTSKDSINSAMNLTQQLLSELGEGKHSEDSTDGTPRSCSLPSRTVLALARPKELRAPWARRYVSIAAPKISEFKRENYSSLERIAGEQPVKNKLNPTAPVFKITTPTGHDHSVYQSTTYSDTAFSVSGVDGREISSSAPSVSSSFHTRASWLYDASKVTSEPGNMEESEMNDWNTIRSHSGPFGHSITSEPYNGDPNSCLFDGPIHTPTPSEGIPAELLNNMKRRNVQLIHHKSETLPYIRGGMVEKSSVREGSFGDDHIAMMGSEGMSIQGTPKSRDESALNVL